MPNGFFAGSGKKQFGNSALEKTDGEKSHDLKAFAIFVKDYVTCMQSFFFSFQMIYESEMQKYCIAPSARLYLPDKKR